MSKVSNMLFLMLGITALLQLAGIPTGLAWLFDYVGLTSTSNGFTGFTGNLSAFWIAILVIFGAASATGIIIGYFTKSSFEWAVLSLYAIPIAIIFISTFVSIINYAAGMDDWIRNAVILIYGLLGIGFLWGLLEWTFGRE